MVYESDFYTVRRPYSRPSITSYSVTNPRHYVVVDSPDRSRRAEEQYSYSYNSNSETLRGSGAPSRNYSSSNETVTRSTAGGPSAYSYSTERSSRSSDYPGSYHSSYSSSTSGRLPHGTTYRHYSYRSPRVSVTTWKVKPSIRTSVLIGELDRIYHRSRPHLSYVPTEDFLNSRPLVDFDDETKSIRAETERIMKRIYTPVPHPRTTTTLPILPYYGQHSIDKYHSPRHHNTLSEDIYNISHYNEPSARTIGRGHLACVSFAGGRGYPRRKHLYSDENRDISDEIKFRSYYNRNRSYEDAMSLPTGFASYLLRLQPDNRNGTLTSSEKLRIMSILKERKEKNNSVGADKVFTSKIMNGNLVDKPSGFKSNSVDETTIPIKRETKLNRSKLKDSKPFETVNKGINDLIESSLLSKNMVEETLDDISSEELMHREIIKDSTKKSILEEPSTKKTNLTPPAVEKIIEVNIEQKLSEEKSKGIAKPSRKVSKTKAETEEEKLKNINESEISAEGKQKEIKDIVIESKVKKEEVLTDMEPQLVDTAEKVDQVQSENTENAIDSINSELSSVENKDDLTINKEDSLNMPQYINSMNTKDNNIENIKETLLNDDQIKNIGTTSEVVPEKNMDNILTENIADSSETQCEKKEEPTNNVQESFNGEYIQETVTESSQEINIESSQAIVSATDQETIEIVYKINETEHQTILHESTSGEQDIHRIEEITSQSVSDKFSEVINTTNNVQTTSRENTKLPETFQLIDTIQSEDRHNELNTEIPTDLNIPAHEKIIDIEIERGEESTESQSIIEEMPNSDYTDIQREPETEPLIEEPQSPESEFICNKNAENEVCEVLSDVPEEV